MKVLISLITIALTIGGSFYAYSQLSAKELDSELIAPVESKALN